MLLLIIKWLEALGYKVPAVFTYCSTRMALAAIGALFITLFFGRVFIRKLYQWKVGETVRQEHCPLLGELHRSKQDTPTMGGILILFSLLVSLLLWMDLKSPFTLLFFLTTVVIGSLGAIDDYLKLRYKNKKGITGRKKLLVQIGFSFCIALYLLCTSCAEVLHIGSWFMPPVAKEGSSELPLALYSSRLYLPFMKNYLIQFSGIGLILMGLFMIFVMTGASNAVNLTDGLDGLAAGTVMMAAASFSIIAFVSNNLDLSHYLNILYIEGSSEIAVFLAALFGACLGFLWYNSHPAQVFMGDTGSLALGAILGLSAILLKKELLLAIVGGIFVVEALSVIIQVSVFKISNGRRFFKCAPLHHHFEYKGWAENKVVVRFWIIALLLSLIGISSLKFQ